MLRFVAILLVAVAATGANASSGFPIPTSLLPLAIHDGRLSVEVANATTNESHYEPIQLRGASVTGMLFDCIHNYSLYDGPSDEAYFEAIKAWNVSIVRVPMNEDCLLGINGVWPQYGGAVYQRALKVLVSKWLQRGFYVILELHWTGSRYHRALGQQFMPDWDHAAAFWKIVASMFGGNRQVIFDLFNEPYPMNNTVDSQAAWECWKFGLAFCDGSVNTAATYAQRKEDAYQLAPHHHPSADDVTSEPFGAQSGFFFNAIGFDDLVAIVRSSGAPKNVIMLGGINYANSLTRWAQYVPSWPAAADAHVVSQVHRRWARYRRCRTTKDAKACRFTLQQKESTIAALQIAQGSVPAARDEMNIAASWHSYSTNVCKTHDCWETTIAGVLRQGYEVITGEFGDVLHCGHWYIDQLLPWLMGGNSMDRLLTFLAWVWAPWNCSGDPVLITNFTGTCTNTYGCTYQGWLNGTIRA